MRVPCILAAMMIAVATMAMAAPAELRPEPGHGIMAGFAVALPDPQSPFPPVESLVYVGAGANTCGRFSELYRQSPAATRGAFFSWTQGFLSGFFSGRDASLAKVGARPEGASQSDFIWRPAGWDYETQWQHLLRFCEKQPDAKFMDAVIDLMNELAAAQPASSPRVH